jgi:hypothetical protein
MEGMTAGGLNRSHVPFGQHSIMIFPQPLRIRLLVLRLCLEMTHDSRDDY